VFFTTELSSTIKTRRISLIGKSKGGSACGGVSGGAGDSRTGRHLDCSSVQGRGCVREGGGRGGGRGPGGHLAQGAAAVESAAGDRAHRQC